MIQFRKVASDILVSSLTSWTSLSVMTFLLLSFEWKAFLRYRDATMMRQWYDIAIPFRLVCAMKNKLKWISTWEMAWFEFHCLSQVTYGWVESFPFSFLFFSLSFWACRGRIFGVVVFLASFVSNCVFTFNAQLECSFWRYVWISAAFLSVVYFRLCYVFVFRFNLDIT